MQLSYLSRSILIALLAVILLAHAWAIFTSAYFFTWWLDSAMHFAGGFWVALTGLFFARSASPKGVFLFLISIGVAATIGILWEFLEFGLNYFWKDLWNQAFLQPSLEDTLTDLFFDLLGGVAVFLLFKNSKEDV